MKTGNKKIHAERKARQKCAEEKFRKEYFANIRKEESEHQKLVNQKK